MSEPETNERKKYDKRKNRNDKDQYLFHGACPPFPVAETIFQQIYFKYVAIYFSFQKTRRHAERLKSFCSL